MTSLLPAQLPRAVRVAAMEYRPLWLIIDDSFIRGAHKPRYLLPESMRRGIEAGRKKNIARLLGMADVGDMLLEEV